jgi:hypothetical protein
VAGGFAYQLVFAYPLLGVGKGRARWVARPPITLLEPTLLPTCMQLPVARFPDSFTLTYLEDQHLLIGRWLRPVALAELQAHYEALLAAAVAHGGCRHWLLDVRRRTINDAAAVQWFGQEFGPRLPQALGQPVVVAYFAMVGQDVATSDPALWENIRQGSLAGAQYCYFDQESTAMAWLSQQP